MHDRRQFLGTALGFAFTQSGWMILVMFVAIAAGMSSPYLLLSAQPAWLRLRRTTFASRRRHTFRLA